MPLDVVYLRMNMSKGEETRYCRLVRAVGKRNICPYVEEERTVMLA
jgi:hypothetical protein